MRQASWALALVVLGASGGASLGSAETLEPSVLVASRPAYSVAGAPYEKSVLHVTRGPRRGEAYRPPPAPQERPIQGWVAFRGGGFDPEDLSGDQWSLGMKVTGVVGPSMRVGFATDWQQRDTDQGSFVTQGVDPAGNPVTRHVTTGETHTDLVPLLGVVEFVLPAGPVQPYFGGGVGWQFLHVRAVDYTTGFWYENDYDGPAAQVYGGVEFAVAPRARLHGEAFYHGGEVDQEIWDPYLGYAYDEEIRTNGWGLRGGFNFAF